MHINPDFSTEKWLEDSLGLLSYRRTITENGHFKYIGLSQKCLEKHLGKPQMIDGTAHRYVVGGNPFNPYSLNHYFSVYYSYWARKKKAVARILEDLD